MRSEARTTLQAIKPNGAERRDVGAWLERVYRQLGRIDPPDPIGTPEPELSPEEEEALLARGRDRFADETAGLIRSGDDRVKRDVIALVAKAEGYLAERHIHTLDAPRTSFGAIFLPTGHVEPLPAGPEAPAPVLHPSSGATQAEAEAGPDAAETEPKPLPSPDDSGDGGKCEDGA